MTPEQLKELSAEHYDEWTHLDAEGYSFEATIRVSEGVEYSLRTSVRGEEEQVRGAIYDYAQTVRAVAATH